MRPRPEHPPAEFDFWRTLVRPLLKRHATPFYLFSVVPIEGALRDLRASFRSLPIRHWLSFKTQPLRALVQWWRRQGLGIEVVSEFELRAALEEGFPAGRILVNGPAKARWLTRYGVRGLLVNFDSLREARSLKRLARQLDWTVGVRLHTSEEFDPESPEFPTQFGMMPGEAVQALRELQRGGLRVEIVHFHLRTNVASPAIYERALRDLAVVCRSARFSPRYVDCGGGFPPPFVGTRQGRAVDARFELDGMARVYERARRQFPGARELWLENGRWLSARSGVLVVTVLEAKDRPRMRRLICDGGRTLHALVSQWETHGWLTLPERRGPECLTAIHGPTCMAFDQLARGPLPRSVRPNDRLVWLEAGAYHLSWETRFSHGLAAVFWHDGRTITQVRPGETFARWWGQWR